MSDDFVPMFTPNKTFTTEVRGTQHTYYLTGPITEPENYVDLCNILRSSTSQDEVLIRINSSGGSVYTERMICNAIEESEANVIGFIEYACMSAATGVFLACKQHGWGPHIQFMVHCAWWNSFGKTPDIKSHTEFASKQMEEEITSTYKGLMSDEELIQCNDGKEFWFGSKELGTRMESFYEYKKSQPCENPDCEECGEQEPQETLEDIIAVAVEKGIAAYDKQRLQREAKAAKMAQQKQPSSRTKKALEEAQEINEDK